MILKAGKYCQYNGDVNQDGIIDLTDLIQVYNDGSNFTSGYVVTDVNGDRFVDLTDVTIAYNNAAIFVAKNVPPGAESSVKISNTNSRTGKKSEIVKRFDSLIKNKNNR